jgi:transcriptional regulator with XRE-family HTH domain
MAKDPTSTRKLTRAGAVLTDSERWQMPLARAAGVSQATISSILSGDRTLTPAIERRIAEGLIETADKLEAQSEKIRTLAMKMLADC